MRRLAAAAPREVRFIEARISGEFRWAPLAGPTGGDTDARTWPLLAAAGEVRQGTDEGSRHAVAVAHLFANDADIAVSQLAAIAEKSRDPAVWNDLSAAHFHVAALRESPDHLKDALAAVDQALLFDPAFAEALFNRALILERFHLRDIATDAWRDFLERADTDGWREEAQKHLDVLTVPQLTFASEIEKHYPRLQDGDRAAARYLSQLDAGDARYFAETEGLARWGEAWLRRTPAAERHLAAVRTLATELTSFNGEALLHDSVAVIETASEHQRDSLARGHVGCRDGRREYDNRNMTAAEKLLHGAERDLSSGGSPLADQVRLYAATAKFWQGRHAEAEADFRALLPSVPAKYAALRANLDWQLATCFMARADTGNSLAHLTRAIEAFTRLRETNNVAYLEDITSQTHDSVRNHRLAANHRARALSVLGKTSNGRLVHAINGLTYAALDRKEWRAARSFLTLQLAANATVNDAELQTTALLRRARLNSQIGDRAAAESDLRAAEAIVAAVPDPAHRAKLQIDCDTATALGSSDPRKAIALLTAVLKFHAKGGWHRLMPEMYLRRGRMYLELNDRLRAASDFESGIALLESHRETIEKGEQRWGILDAAEELFDEAITEALRVDAERAFDYAERKRARSLSDTLQKGQRTFDYKLLPSDTLVVEYAALPEKLLIFVVDRRRLHVREIPIRRVQLDTLARQFLAALQNDDVRQRSKLAAQLDEHLVAPIRAFITTHREVVFVTDAATSGIAFAALPGTAPGRMLVEDVTISVSPSAKLYHASRMRRGALRARLKILIVDSPENRVLERLPSTNKEAKAVQAIYPRAWRLTARDATRDAFIERSRDANIIHFAGHAVASVESAALIFTETPDDSGLFDAASISRLRLPDTDIVVLAACETARGPVRSAEGVTSVTHAFLQAGVPVVIATLWPLEDRDAAIFFPRLHRHLSRGASPAEALRLAQLEWIRNSPDDRAALWAAVQSIGY